MKTMGTGRPWVHEDHVYRKTVSIQEDREYTGRLYEYGIRRLWVHEDYMGTRRLWVHEDYGCRRLWVLEDHAQKAMGTEGHKCMKTISIKEDYGYIIIDYVYMKTIGKRYNETVFYGKNVCKKCSPNRAFDILHVLFHA